MASYTKTDQFKSDFAGLTREQKAAFIEAAMKFSEDLDAQTDPRSSLRISSLKGWHGVFEFSYEGNDGRATFEYGPEVVKDKKHVIWRRVGTHKVFDKP